MSDLCQLLYGNRFGMMFLYISENGRSVSVSRDSVEAVCSVQSPGVDASR